MTTSTRRPFTAELRRHAQSTAGAEAAPASADAQALQDMMSMMRNMSADMGTLRAEVTALRQMVVDIPRPVMEASQNDAAIADVSHEDEVTTLKTELRALAFCIEQTKAEIAGLRSGEEEKDHLSVMSTELDEVVSATEGATDQILDSCEAVEHLVEALKSNLDDSFARQTLDEIVENTTKIFEACNFQDITGQRITKVVRTLQFVDERITTMIDIWGSDSLASLQGADLQVFTREDTVDLNGPQVGDQGISQDEIDKLFD